VEDEGIEMRLEFLFQAQDAAVIADSLGHLFDDLKIMRIIETCSMFNS
jgi:chemotaxis protein CheY-P-specific phosphatase CheC